MGVDTKLRLIDGTTLEKRVIPALADFIDCNDPTAVKLLFEETLASEKCQYALASDKVIAEHLAEGSQDLITGNIPDKIKDLAHAGRWLVDRGEIKRHLAQETLNRFL